MINKLSFGSVKFTLPKKNSPEMKKYEELKTDLENKDYNIYTASRDDFGHDKNNKLIIEETIQIEAPFTMIYSERKEADKGVQKRIIDSEIDPLARIIDDYKEMPKTTTQIGEWLEANCGLKPKTSLNIDSPKEEEKPIETSQAAEKAEELSPQKEENNTTADTAYCYKNQHPGYLC